MRTAHINNLFEAKAQKVLEDKKRQAQQDMMFIQEEANKQNRLVETSRTKLEIATLNASQLLKRKNEFSDFVQKTAKFCLLTESRPAYELRGKAKKGDPLLGIEMTVRELDTTPRYYSIISITDVVWNNEEEKVVTIALDISREPLRELNFKEVRVRCGEIKTSGSIPTFHEYIPPSDELIGVLDRLSTPEGFIELFISTYVHML